MSRAYTELMKSRLHVENFYSTIRHTYYAIVATRRDLAGG
jgi:hypothetical protein